MAQAFSNQGPNAAANEYALFMTMFEAAIKQVQTVSIVRVEKCTNAGGIVPAGTVDVTVLVNIMGANGAGIPHDVISGVSYYRQQSGGNGIIMDPKHGDIGIALFCSRDSSVVKKSKARANPGSLRIFDWADGLYLGGVLNGTPTQYLAFLAGITLASPVVSTTGNLSAGTGASGVFTTPTGQTVTVQNGIITNIA